MKTCIRWAGSKKALLPVLIPFWESKYRRYLEPFCGSACLFFELEPKKAILGDINDELISTYRAIKREPLEVIKRLRRLSLDKKTYYALRDQDTSDLSEVQIAVRFLLLNRMCFNGIFRTNLSGRFNVPYAPPKNRRSFDFDGIKGMSLLLQRATLLKVDFEKTLERAKKGDFVYLDPPYAVAARRVFSDYHPNSFSGTDLHRLRAALASLHVRGAHFLVSYADSAEGRKLVKGWYWRRVRARRHIAGFAAHRRNAYELIASNQELPHVS